ncbi:MAG: NusG domain II-containing protein [Blautia sp.]|nr:NusG domain II-containing protein [Blautia sp.]
MKKKDFAVIALLLAASAAGIFLQKKLMNTVGKTAIVQQSGEIIAELDLNENTTITVPFGNAESNTICVENGTVYISEADCPDLICQYTPPIANTGEIIACLPHELIIVINDPEDPDSTVW